MTSRRGFFKKMTTSLAGALLALQLTEFGGPATIPEPVTPKPVPQSKAWRFQNSSGQWAEIEFDWNRWPSRADVESAPVPPEGYDMDARVVDVQPVPSKWVPDAE